MWSNTWRLHRTERRNLDGAVLIVVAQKFSLCFVLCNLTLLFSTQQNLSLSARTSRNDMKCSLNV